MVATYWIIAGSLVVIAGCTCSEAHRRSDAGPGADAGLDCGPGMVGAVIELDGTIVARCIALSDDIVHEYDVCSPISAHVVARSPELSVSFGSDVTTHFLFAEPGDAGVILRVSGTDVCGAEWCVWTLGEDYCPFVVDTPGEPGDRVAGHLSAPCTIATVLPERPGAGSLVVRAMTVEGPLVERGRDPECPSP